ncbi:hypothetical protein ACN28I_37875 [Archangium gephyra]|uniref:hypothetical protein n=1 Tax=Archangium gephyra TaxID=48 RepID=UPI003B78F53E
MLKTRLDNQEGLYRELKAYYSLQHSASWTPSRDEFGVRDPNHNITRSTLDSTRRRVLAQLRSAGFKDVEDFERSISEFLSSFQKAALAISLGMLASYEQVLQKEKSRYLNRSNAMALHQALSHTRAREYYSQAVAAERDARSIRPDPDLHRYMPGEFKMKVDSQQRASEARRLAEVEFAKAAEAHPLLRNKDLERESLANASPAEVQSVMLDYIQARLKDVAETRKNLTGNSVLVFKLDALLRATYAVIGIASGSIYDLILQDRIRSIQGQEAIIALALGVLALAAGLLSAGGGTVAVLAVGAGVGIGVGDALMALRQYEIQSAAHGAQLLSDDPSLGWVIVAVLGAGGELAIVAAAIKAMKPAVLLFNKSGDLVQLEKGLKALPQVKSELRTQILSAARQEHQYQQVARRTANQEVTPGTPGRGLFGKQSPAPSGPLSPELPAAVPAGARIQMVPDQAVRLCEAHPQGSHRLGCIDQDGADRGVPRVRNRPADASERWIRRLLRRKAGSWNEQAHSQDSHHRT